MGGQSFVANRCERHGIGEGQVVLPTGCLAPSMTVTLTAPSSVIEGSVFDLFSWLKRTRHAAKRMSRALGRSQSNICRLPRLARF